MAQAAQAMNAAPLFEAGKTIPEQGSTYHKLLLALQSTDVAKARLDFLKEMSMEGEPESIKAQHQQAMEKATQDYLNAQTQLEKIKQKYDTASQKQRP